MEIKVTGKAEYGQWIKALICGEPGSGKGLTLDTPVLTPNGWVPIGKLEVGDQIIGSNGKPVGVTDIFDRGLLPIYEVKFSDGASVLCDGDHLWSLETRKTHYTTKNLVTLSVDELRTQMLKRGKNKFSYYVPLVNPVELNKKQLTIEPYLLGVLLANGSLGDTSTVFYTNDEEIVDRVQSLNPELTITRICETSSVAKRWLIKDFNDALRSLNLKGLRSREKFIPEDYLESSVEDRQLLLAGLVDCDGSARGTRKPLYFTTSPMLRDGVIALVRSLGGIATWSVDLRDGARPCFSVSMKLPESPFLLSRKRDADQYKRLPFRGLESITPAGEAETRCIKVDAGDELFVVDHFLLTHNTLLSSTFLNPVYASAEGGLMSVADRKVPYVEIGQTSDLSQLKIALSQAPDAREKIFGSKIDTVILDTIDEIQRIVIREKLQVDKKDKLSLPDFGWLGQQLEGIIRGFRNLDMNVVFTCHLRESKDEDLGRVIYKPQLQGQISDQITGMVDIAAVLKTKTLTEVVDGVGKRSIKRYLQTFPDAQIPWIKDRSGKLPQEFQVNFNDDYARMHQLIYGAATKQAEKQLEMPISDAEKQEKK